MIIRNLACLTFILLCNLFFSDNTIGQISSANMQADIQLAWNLLKNAKPIDQTTKAWERAATERLLKGICISGNCENGYGISIENDRGFTARYQYEGKFENGVKSTTGVSTNSNGVLIATVGDVRITKKGLLYKIDRPSEKGFALADINFFQNLAFAHLYKCNCLTPTYDHPVEVYYTQRNEIVNGFGDHVRYENETKSRTEYTAGLLNSTKENIYVRAYSKRRTFKYGTKNNPVAYFDESFVVESNESMEKADFSLIPNDNGKSINAEELETLGYTMDEEQLRNKGFSEYVRFVTQYTPNMALVSECNKRQQTISFIAQSLGNNKYKVDAYTATTKIKIKPGDKIILNATGKIRYARDKEENGPEGTTSYSFFGRDERLFTDNKLGCLLANVGDCEWTEVGDSYEWVTQCEGELNLMINDNNPSNNTGSFIVEVKIIRAR